MQYLVSSFSSIIRFISEDQILCEESTRIDDLFNDEFDDLDFEMALCVFEATHRVSFSSELSDIPPDEYGNMTIEEFIEKYVLPEEQRDPQFITKRFLMVREAMEEYYAGEDSDSPDSFEDEN